MSIQKLTKLEQYFHDLAVSCRTSKNCGKLIIGVDLMEQVASKIEQLIETIIVMETEKE